MRILKYSTSFFSGIELLSGQVFVFKVKNLDSYINDDKNLDPTAHLVHRREKKLINANSNPQISQIKMHEIFRDFFNQAEKYLKFYYVGNAWCMI